jgi:hypothetical protein
VVPGELPEPVRELERSLQWTVRTGADGVEASIVAFVPNAFVITAIDRRGEAPG